jgi:acyl-CoA thioesterase I
MKNAFLAIALALAPLPAAAQVAVLPLSSACNAPNADIAAPAPLPRTTQLLSEKAPMLRILAIGSSSTWGIGASSRHKAYPAVLQGILERSLRGIKAEIVNSGVSGEVAETTAERLRTEVALRKPDLVLWQVGTNDALARIDPEQFEETVRSTIQWLKDDKIDIVLVGLQYTPKFARDQSYFAIRERLSQIAKEQNVLYVRRYAAMQFIAAHQSDDLMSGDDLHLNDLGYRCMAEHIAHAVTANLFVHKRDLPKPTD